jgi:hypothetical protein
MWKTGITQILDAFLVCSPHASLYGGQDLPQKRELVVCGKEGLHATFAVFSRALIGMRKLSTFPPQLAPSVSRKKAEKKGKSFLCP